MAKLKKNNKKKKQHHAKCMHFAKMQLFPNCYTAVLYEPISRIYLSRRVTFLFLQDTGTEKADYSKVLAGLYMVK